MKTLTNEEVRSRGLMQEVNRCFFHPRGMALCMAEVDTHPYAVGGTARAVGLLQIRDSGDPIGMAFDWPVDADKIDVVRQKAVSVALMREEREKSRFDTLGYVLQPLPKSTYDLEWPTPDQEKLALARGALATVLTMLEPRAPELAFTEEEKRDLLAEVKRVMAATALELQ